MELIRRHLSTADALVLSAAAALLAGLYIALWSRDAEQGRMASIWVADERLRTVRLDEPQTIRVDGPLGESVIEVREGRIRVVDSPGRQKLCVNAGWLSRGGESAICLPNRVVVRVSGDRPRFDTVNF